MHHLNPLSLTKRRFQQKEDMLGKGTLICEGEFFLERKKYNGEERPEVLSY